MSDTLQTMFGLCCRYCTTWHLQSIVSSVAKKDQPIIELNTLRKFGGGDAKDS